jgi:hypothetical protein
LIFLNGNQQGTRAWRLDSAATVKTRVGSVAIQNMERDAPWTAWIKMIQQREEAFLRPWTFDFESFDFLPPQ